VRPLAVAAAALALAFALASAAAAAPPRAGLFVPGVSLGGLHLGMTEAQVRRAWGSGYGVCRGCADLTWYYNYRPYRPQGAGVMFRRGHAVAVFTHWAPRGWHTPGRVTIGAPAAVVSQRYDALPPTNCTRYTVVNVVRLNVINAFYIVDDKVWGFGLTTGRVAPCLP
jgi:hypothetical protein